MVLVWFMVFDATFNNILVILWQSILLVEETGENHRPVASHWQTLLHYVVSSTPPSDACYKIFGDVAPTELYQWMI